jgi:hypothetical protein
MFLKGDVEPGARDALYETNQAILSDAASGADIRYFSIARRTGDARGLRPHPATSQHRRFHTFADCLRRSARRNARARDLNNAIAGLDQDQEPQAPRLAGDGSHLVGDSASVKSPSRPHFRTKAQHSNSTSASRANPLAPNADRAGKCPSAAICSQGIEAPFGCRSNRLPPGASRSTTSVNATASAENQQ